MSQREKRGLVVCAGERQDQQVQGRRQASDTSHRGGGGVGEYGALPLVNSAEPVGLVAPLSSE